MIPVGFEYERAATIDEALPRRAESAAAPAAVVKCPRCGTANDSDAQFCKRCGTGLEPGE